MCVWVSFLPLYVILTSSILLNNRFRKIKYADTLVIDKKLEAETANYWRFRHDKFQRGKPELLVEIKRSNGQHSTASGSAKAEDANLKSEVSTLKKRIEAMTKNIDDLTSLVEKVSLKQDVPIKEEMDVEVGNKRKKVEMPKYEDVRPDEALSAGMELEKDLAILQEPPLPAPQVLPRRQSSDTTQLSDDDFVNQLFTAFGNDDGALGLADSMELEPLRSSSEEKDNSPDPELMKKLSDALTLLPRDIQELIVNRLIDSITGTACLDKDINSAATVLSDTTQEAATSSPLKVPPSPVLGATPEPEVPLSLAAATLAAFLSHYGTTVKDKALQKSMQKAAVPIPIHA